MVWMRVWSWGSVTMTVLKASERVRAWISLAGMGPMPAISQRSPGRVWPRWAAVASMR
jgi:hypothetical protein